MGCYVQSKKELKEKFMGAEVSKMIEDGVIVETSMFGPEYNGDMFYPIVGPDPYKNRKWFAEIKVEGGKIVKIR